MERENNPSQWISLLFFLTSVTNYLLSAIFSFHFYLCKLILIYQCRASHVPTLSYTSVNEQTQKLLSQKHIVL